MVFVMDSDGNADDLHMIQMIFPTCCTLRVAQTPTVPAHIREVLVSRYEYIVAEREVVPDLTDDLRLCETCEKWCPP